MEVAEETEGKVQGLTIRMRRCLSPCGLRVWSPPPSPSLTLTPTPLSGWASHVRQEDKCTLPKAVLGRSSDKAKDSLQMHGPLFLVSFLSLSFLLSLAIVTLTSYPQYLSYLYVSVCLAIFLLSLYIYSTSVCLSAFISLSPLCICHSLSLSFSVCLSCIL